MTRLSIGVILPSATTASGEVGERARHAEDIGLDALFSGDHLAADPPTLDGTVLLATAAAVTVRLKIGFGVMVLALRHPAWAAKQIASLQHVTGNRLVLGVGAGGAVHGSAAWDAVGIPYAERGRRTDAALDVLPGLVAGKPAAGVPNAVTPEAAMPPVWVGGGSAAALRRTARYGDAWFPSMITPEMAAGGRRRLAELAAEYGRPVPRLAVGGGALLGQGHPAAALDGFTAGLVRYGLSPQAAAEIPITGTPARAAERFRQYAEAGADHLILGIIGDDWRRQYELIAEARALAEQP